MNDTYTRGTIEWIISEISERDEPDIRFSLKHGHGCQGIKIEKLPSDETDPECAVLGCHVSEPLLYLNIEDANQQHLCPEHSLTFIEETKERLCEGCAAWLDEQEGDV